MSLRAVFSALSFLAFLTPHPVRASSNAEEFCARIAPSPSQVTQFYEDNPTYAIPGGSPNIWPTGTPESQGLKSSTLLSGVSAFEKLPQSLSLLVLRRGVLVLERYFHGSHSGDANNIHSSSKASLISTLVGIALQKGYLKNLDQPLGELLSGFAMSSKKKAITLRHLLTMTAGWKWTEDETEYDIEALNNWVQGILNLPLATTPGTQFNYCTGNTHLLSAILTEASGMSTCALAKTHLFDPLGIQVQHWGRDPQGYYSGGYNVYLAPRDLLKLGQLYLQDGKWNGVSILPPGWPAKAWHPAVNENATYDYGFLWHLTKLAGNPVYKMWGYGGQFVYVVPSLDLVVVLTSDTKKDYPEQEGNDFLSRYVLSAIQKKSGH